LELNEVFTLKEPRIHKKPGWGPLKAEHDQRMLIKQEGQNTRDLGITCMRLGRYRVVVSSLSSQI